MGTNFFSTTLLFLILRNIGVFQSNLPILICTISPKDQVDMVSPKSTFRASVFAASDCGHYPWRAEMNLPFSTFRGFLTQHSLLEKMSSFSGLYVRKDIFSPFFKYVKTNKFHIKKLKMLIILIETNLILFLKITCCSSTQKSQQSIDHMILR